MESDASGLPFDQALIRAHDFGAMNLTMVMVEETLQSLEDCQVAMQCVEGMGPEWIAVNKADADKTDKTAEAFFIKAASQLEKHLGISA